MALLTIPKKAASEDLVIVPKREYQALLRARVSRIGEVGMTPAQKRALARARKNMKRGKVLSLDEFSKKMAR